MLRSNLAIQREKKERKAKSASSSSFPGFSSSMPILLCKSSSIGEVIVTSVPYTSCSVTFSSSTQIISAQPFISLNVPFVGELRRKHKEDSSEAYFISKEDMWAKFQKCLSAISSSLSRPSCFPEDHSGPSSSTALSACNGPPAQSPSARVPSPVWLSSAHHLACPSAPATPDSSAQSSDPTHHFFSSQPGSPTSLSAVSRSPVSCAALLPHLPSLEVWPQHSPLQAASPCSLPVHSSHSSPLLWTSSSLVLRDPVVEHSRSASCFSTFRRGSHGKSSDKPSHSQHSSSRFTSVVRECRSLSSSFPLIVPNHILLGVFVLLLCSQAARPHLCVSDLLLVLRSVSRSLFQISSVFFN